MEYFVFSTIFASFAWLRNYGIFPFIVFVLCLPLGNAFTQYFYQYGLFSVDFYFFSLLIRLGINYRLPIRPALASLTIVFVYSLVALANDSKLDIYFARDFRLLIFTLSITALIGIQKRTIEISPQALNLLAILAGASCAAYSVAISFDLISYQDEYYSANSFRFFTVASYFCFGFIAFNALLPTEFKRGILYYTAFALSLLAVSLTGFRVFSFLAVALFFVGSVRSRRGVIATTLAISLVFPVVTTTQDGLLSDRITSVSPDVLLANWEARISPFIEIFKKMSGLELMFGSGFGQVFQIPWFEYREYKDVYNNYIDNLYLTLYTKFGILSIFILIEYFRNYKILLHLNSFNQKFTLAICLMLLWLVYSTPYQLVAPGLAIALFCVGSARASSLRMIRPESIG